MKVLDVYNALDRFAPFCSAAGWDNSGLLIGDPDAAVSRVFLCLDVTEEALAEAQRCGAELIVSHHLVIFRPLKSISYASIQAKLLRAGLHVICAHTNLDKAAGGVNDSLCAALGVPYEKMPPEVAEGFLNVCTLPEAVSEEAFAALLQTKLGARVSFLPRARAVSKIGVCSGAGADFVKEAAQSGCDAYLTGEASHHEYLDAAAEGITLFTAGHYETEIMATKALEACLREALPELGITRAKETLPFLTQI